MDNHQTTPDATTAPAEPAPFAGFKPYEAAIEGWTPGDPNNTADLLTDWPNSVAVTTIEGWSSITPDTESPDEAEEEYADNAYGRQLVEIDTNYKPTRTSEHPVRLTRTQTIALAVHLLEATEDTFHGARVGRLRATEAAELLQALGAVDAALLDLREHALGDLAYDLNPEQD